MPNVANDMARLEPALIEHGEGAVPEYVVPPNVMERERMFAFTVPRLENARAPLVESAVQVKVMLAGDVLVTVVALIAALTAETCAVIAIAAGAVAETVVVVVDVSVLVAVSTMVEVCCVVD